MWLVTIRKSLVIISFLFLFMTPSFQIQAQEDLAKQSQNPLGTIISVPFENNIYSGIGPSDATSYILNMKPVYPIKRAWISPTSCGLYNQQPPEWRQWQWPNYWHWLSISTQALVRTRWCRWICWRRFRALAALGRRIYSPTQELGIDCRRWCGSSQRARWPRCGYTKKRMGDPNWRGLSISNLRQVGHRSWIQFRFFRAPNPIRIRHCHWFWVLTNYVGHNEWWQWGVWNYWEY